MHEALSKNLCAGSPTNSTEGSNRRLLVYQHCIPLCESGDLQTEVAADIIGLLMLEVDAAPLEFTLKNGTSSSVRTLMLPHTQISV